MQENDIAQFQKQHEINLTTVNKQISMGEQTLDANLSAIPDSSQASSQGNGSAFQTTQLWQLLASIGDTTPPESATPTEPVVILGHEYTDKEKYEKDIYSRIWLTYRFGFEKIAKAENGPHPLSFIQSLIFNKSVLFNSFHHFPNMVDNEHFTTDVGWGCMIRTSQSLLANSYLHLLSEVSEESTKLIIDLFQDKSNAPFSLHNFINVASASPLRVKPGEWFGPNAASLSIKRLCDRLLSQKPPQAKNVPNIKVLISESSDVYDNQIADAFAAPEIDGLLLLFPVRLGIDKVNEYYYSSLKQLLASRHSVGIAGGKPSSSFYFVGYEGSNIIYLNPHNPQPCKDEIDYSSYHTLNYQKLSISNLDPSMMVGILLKNLDDYQDFKKLGEDKSHKIVHFHTSARGVCRPEPASRKASVSANATSGLDVKEDDEDFINVNTTKKDIQFDDFVDLGDGDNSQNQSEYRADEKISSIPLNEEPEVINAVVPPESTAQEPAPKELVRANSEPFETISRTDCDAS